MALIIPGSRVRVPSALLCEAAGRGRITGHESRRRSRCARRIRPGSLIAGFPHTVRRGDRTVCFVDGTNRDGSLVVRQLGWVPVTVTSARLITPALVAGDCTLT